MFEPRRIAGGLSALGMVTIGLFTIAGCGSDSPAGRGSVPVGRPDQTHAASLSIDEAAISGTASNGRLALAIPLKNDGLFSATGSLTVTIAQVDGSTSFGARAVTYDVPAGATSNLAAELALPPGVAAQADWSAFSVLVEGAPGQGLRVTRSLLTVIGVYDVELAGPKTVTPGRNASYRVVAQDPRSRAPLPNVAVTLTVKSGDKVVTTLEAMTGPKGDAVFNVPLSLPGDAVVEVSGSVRGTRMLLSDTVTVQAPGSKVLLTTDKPLYQPGQTIHLRALALDRVTQKPMNGQPVTFEISDGKGNKICKRTRQSDDYGLAATDFVLGQVLNMGTFQLRVLVGTDKAEKTVTVSRYALPKFKVDVTPDKPWYTPGQTVSGTVDARYFFGKVAAGADVAVEAATLDIGQTVFGRVMGKTDAQGRFPFTVTLPTVLVGLPIQAGSGLVNLTVKVTDTAGQQVTQQTPVTVASRPLRLALVPEGGQLVPGIPNGIGVFVTDPLGAPAGEAAVSVALGATTIFSGKTDAFGQVSFDWTPDAGAGALMVQAKTKEGLVVTEPFQLNQQTGTTHVLVRTDRAVYGPGDKVVVDVVTSAGPSTVFLDWLTGGQDVDMQTLAVANGVAHFEKTVDPGLVGSNRVEAYVVDAQGNITRAGRTIFVRDRAALSVDLTTDAAQYTPGAPAKLTFTVKDETGAPAVAALGVQIVDQAVFALVDTQPGLLRTYFQLEDQFSQPTYELRPPAADLQRVIFDETSVADKASADAAQVRAAAILASMRGSTVMGIQKSSGATFGLDVRTKLSPFFEKEKARLEPAVQATTQAGIAKLRALGCLPTTYYCSTRDSSYFAALQQEIVAGLEAYDFWGNAYVASAPTTGELVRLTTRGPDETAATDDDTVVVFRDTDLDLPTDVKNAAHGVFQDGPEFNGGVQPGAGGLPIPANTPPVGPMAMGGGVTTAPGTTPGTTPGGEPPRVRSDFPETLYVNPEIITGADGKATISVDMADSITEWRVSSLAHSQAGKVGGGVGGVKVFQEFFVDIDFPATMTRGDTVEFPVAIYNYLPTPQTVHVALEPASWYTALGATSADVPLAAGQVTGIRFPVRVGAVGRQTLTVKATGGTRSDAVARGVLVQPDGLEVPRAQSGSLAAGAATLPVSFPAGAIPGSQKLYVDVFPAYLSQVIQGMDSLLRVPNGCFEQTTSTAWPNVLVTDYLKQTNQLKPEIQLKAESLMSAGYQRLLTFEHTGGGFSWFGEQDPAPYLSVTAFGLMEFSDMAKVQTVDPAMVARTTAWLVGQQAADGSWAGDRSEFFTFQTSLLRNTAFVIWALASAGDKGPELAKGLAFVKQELAKEKPDAYTLAIVANAFLTAAPTDPAASGVLDQIAAAAKVTGDKASWDTGGTQTNFYGGGSDGAVATTALCAHALLLSGTNKGLVDQALAYLSSTKDSMGNFGSTQATIWTLRALLLAAKKGTEGAVGLFTVAVDGAPFGQVTLTKDQSDVVTTIDLTSLATTGAHDVALAFAGTGKVSYNLVSQHHVPWAMMSTPPAGPLSISLSYDKTSLMVDDSALATVTVKNNTQSQQDMILVTVGIPPGFQVQTDDLDAYKKAQTLSSYELTGKQLILYVPSLKASASQAFSYHLRATMPVTASDGGMTAILYYQPDKKVVSPATLITAVSPH